MAVIGAKREAPARGGAGASLGSADVFGRGRNATMDNVYGGRSFLTLILRKTGLDAAHGRMLPVLDLDPVIAPAAAVGARGRRFAHVKSLAGGRPLSLCLKICRRSARWWSRSAR